MPKTGIPPKELVRITATEEKTGNEGFLGMVVGFYAF